MAAAFREFPPAEFGVISRKTVHTSLARGHEGHLSLSHRPVKVALFLREQRRPADGWPASLTRTLRGRLQKSQLLLF